MQLQVLGLNLYYKVYYKHMRFPENSMKYLSKPILYNICEGLYSLSQLATPKTSKKWLLRNLLEKVS